MAKKDRDDEKKSTSTKPDDSAPLLNFDGSLKVADLGGGVALGSDGHLHIGGIDIMGS